MSLFFPLKSIDLDELKVQVTSSLLRSTVNLTIRNIRVELVQFSTSTKHYINSVDLKWCKVEKDQRSDTWVCKTSTTVAIKLSRDVLAYTWVRNRRQLEGVPGIGRRDYYIILHTTYMNRATIIEFECKHLRLFCKSYKGTYCWQRPDNSSLER